jgi:hypothetical protein
MEDGFDTFYFGQGRLAMYNKFPDEHDGNIKKKGEKDEKGEKGMLYRVFSGILNFQVYNKSILRYKVNEKEKNAGDADGADGSL